MFSQIKSRDWAKKSAGIHSLNLILRHLKSDVDKSCVLSSPTNTLPRNDHIKHHKTTLSLFLRKKNSIVFHCFPHVSWLNAQKHGKNSHVFPIFIGSHPPKEMDDATLPLESPRWWWNPCGALKNLTLHCRTGGLR